ncbi:MAG: DUF1684 domain-containing protein [Candidatus Limnocylindrales bacterium]
MTELHEHHEHHEHQHHHEHDHRPVDYATSVEAFRADKDDYFKNAGAGSPIPVAERDAFTGLPYFPVDPALRFEDRTLEPYTGGEPSSFQIPTSDGRLRPAHRAGILAFDIGGQRRALTAYTFDDGDGDGESLFVPFLDATSGTETYGAGRYLDLEPEEDGTYTLDFNLAYHPSCVYDIRFSCPLTPAENWLPIRIEAGERLRPTG